MGMCHFIRRSVGSALNDFSIILPPIDQTLPQDIHGRRKNKDTAGIRAFSEIIRDRGKKRLAEKAPSNALRLGFVDQVFPDCRFIHIIRNGLDSALSIRQHWQKHSGGLGAGHVRQDVLRQRLKELDWRRLPYYSKEFIRRITPNVFSPLVGPRVWGPRIPGIEGLVRDLSLLEVCCLQWRMCVESACHYGRQMPPGRYLEFKLEEMSRDDVKSMLAFCELEETPEVMAYFDDLFDPDKPSARRSAADASEIQTMLRWVEPTLHWLGYPIP